MNRLFDYIAGYRYYFFEGEDRGRVSSALIGGSVPHTARNMRDGAFRVKIRLRRCGTAETLFRENDATFTRSPETGLPALTKKLVKRPGLIVGLILFLALSRLSSGVVWDVRLPENCDFTDEEIITILSDEGFSIGTFFRKIDFDDLNSRVMANNSDVAWISVNMRGAVAEVDVRRAEHGVAPDRPDGVYANLVAKEDAQIVLVHTDEGTPEVSCGDVVKSGDLLVSGIVPLRDGGVRFAYASGEVTADVLRSFSVPLENKVTVKRYTGRCVRDRALIFFKKNVNLSRNGRIKYTSYDKIEKDERRYLFGNIPLPLRSLSTEYREYEEIERILTPEESLDEAKKKMRELTDEALRDAELISKKITVVTDGDEIVLKCDLVCRVDVGETVEFNVSEKNGAYENTEDADKK